MEDNKKSENAKKLLTLQTILDENTRIETITDKETLKNIIRKIIGVTSYSKIKRGDITGIIEEVCQEFGMKH